MEDVQSLLIDDLLIELSILDNLSHLLVWELYKHIFGFKVCVNDSTDSV
jgi:hypothetical protein